MYINKKLMIGILVVTITLISGVVVWNLLPASKIYNRLNSKDIKINTQEFLALISNLKMIYPKSKIKYVGVTLTDETPNKESLAFWRPDRTNPSSYIDGCKLEKSKNEIQIQKTVFHINKLQYKLRIKEINRDLNYCIGLIFLENSSEISQIESLQKYMDLSGGTKNILSNKNN